MLYDLTTDDKVAKTVSRGRVMGDIRGDGRL